MIVKRFQNHVAESRIALPFIGVYAFLIFAAGVLFGTAGIKILTSKDAKKLYTNCTAAVLRAKSCIMKTATTVQENCEDIYADAKTINETKYNTEEVVLDSVDEDEEA